ncbi:hypothetical protein Cgig2_001835 [Carnegiea gigantea]|uniref:Uncharacterized protein n=1 Tax=Carnegiea gigantea TaxID=171969 RepID=A0A9Q1QA44_9CARY|nr:hypothetical protein Cgig2_001835 [Carnegiea gigantea]
MEAAGFAFSVAQTLLAALSYPPLQHMFTMWGYQSELESLTSTVSTVSAVLRDAQSVNVEKLSHCERNLIEKLKEAVYDADDLLDEFATLAKQQHQLCMEANQKSLKKVQHLFSRFKELKVAYSMSRKVKDIRKKLDQIVDDAKFGFIKVDRQPIRKREETYAYVNEKRIVGRDVDKARIVNMLLDPHIQRDVPVLAIVGMGGLGKTALAQLVYSDERIQTQFHKRTYWVCVSDQDQKQFSIKAILARIWKVATGDSNIGDLDMDSLVRRVRDQLNQNKYLLVLDDVWTEDRIECNKLLDILMGSCQVAKTGSKIVVTTRSKKTATVMGCNHPYELQGLSDENSWLLFKITSGLEQENCHDELSEEWHGLTATPKDEDIIMPILKFSYDNLSPSMKSCFIYCAMFPKDSELQKEMLISLWVAHDYVKDEGRQGIEVAADYYFNILVQRCFFQDVHEDDYKGTITFKIHDLMHDMAHQVAGKEIFIASSSTTNLGKNIRHLYDAAPGRCTKGFMAKSKIRSYIKADEVTSDNITFPVSALLTNWRSLRVLDLSDLGITYLPNAIGELLHLRWLNLDGNKELKKLPKSLTKLINLQTLSVEECSELEELPEDFSKLINLRALYVTYDEDDGLQCMPLGMEKMACLTRLNKFVLGQRKSSVKGEVRVEDLRLPRNIRGSLEIYISPKYKHSKEYGGGGGYLCNTKYLKSVSIECRWKAYERARMADDDVLEDLQPHSNLKELTIVDYPRLTMPQWAREDGLATSLPNLVKICLENCNRLKELPCLGKLQSLKTLQLYSLENLKYMENKTRDTNIDGSSDGAASSSMAAKIFFPSLENLELYDLPKLKGWWRGERLPLFPCLSQVRIEECPNLRSIPLGPAVETLMLKRSGRMKVVGGTSSNDYGNSGSYDPKIKEIKTSNLRLLKSLPMVAFQGLTKMEIYSDDEVQSLLEVEEVFHGCSSSLRFLKVDCCMELRCVSSGLQHLTALESLELVYLPKLVELPKGGCSSSLRFLKVQYCDNLRCVSSGLQHLTALESLELVCLPRVVELPKGMRYLTALQSLKIDGLAGLEDLPEWMPWRCLAQCLRSLELCYLPKVVELPRGMRHLTALQSLKIVRLPGLKEVPQSIACLPSLHSLEIWDCEDFKSLPEALGSLTSLKIY